MKSRALSLSGAHRVEELADLDRWSRLMARAPEDIRVVLIWGSKVKPWVHADDLVAHVQEHETWDVLSLPAVAEQEENYNITTPYGPKLITRKIGEILQPTLLSLTTLEIHRRAMTEYNFAAQYQQNPEPPSGIIVKREWLRFYSPEEKPVKFDLIVQSWDTANKDTELANFSVCTTWGLKDKRMYLLDVFRRKIEFPDLKRSVRELAKLHGANIVLVEDKASGTSLIQELLGDHFSIVQAAPALDGDKTMRLRAQTAKIEGGFVLFPKEAHWLNAYLLELITFPNSKNDDQVDSTVFALAWMTSNPKWSGWTDESIKGLESLTSGLLFDRLFRG